MPSLEHFEKVFRRVINSKKLTRYKMRRVLRRLLSEHGWQQVDESELGDVVGYLRSSGVFIIIKLWVNPEREPVPRFFVENFLRGIYKTSESCKSTPLFDPHVCKECEQFCLLSKRVYKYFLSNAPLDSDAYAYFRANAKSTKLILADIVKGDHGRQGLGIDWSSRSQAGTLDIFTTSSSG